MNEPNRTNTLDRALEGLAVGRIIWGLAAYAAPEANARVAGLPDRPSGEVVYLTRVFGSRAFALGCGYLLSDTGARTRWRRLGLAVDIGDTAAGIMHLVRGDIPRRSAAMLTVATGAYAAIGAARLVKDLRPRRQRVDRCWSAEGPKRPRAGADRRNLGGERLDAIL